MENRVFSHSLGVICLLFGTGNMDKTGTERCLFVVFVCFLILL